jgi:hypothetical protein
MPRGYRTIRFPTDDAGIVPVYTSARLADALQEIIDNSSLYDGVRLTQIMEAVYGQGRKDGARAAFEATERSLATARHAIPHKKPGRPRVR